MNIYNQNEVDSFINENRVLDPSFSRPDVLVLLFMLYALKDDLNSARKTLIELRLRPLTLLSGIYLTYGGRDLWINYSRSIGGGLEKMSPFLAFLVTEYFSMVDPDFNKVLFPSQYESAINEGGLYTFTRDPHPNPNVEVVIIVRKHWWENHPNSREHDIGPRLRSAFGSLGWRSNSCAPSETELRALALGNYEKRVAIVDIQSHLFTESARIDEGRRVIDYLKNNNFIVIGIGLDAWREDCFANEFCSTTYLDYFWNAQPSTYPLYTNKFPEERVIKIPHALTGLNNRQLSQLKSKAASRDIGFVGSIEGNNSTRLLWKTILNATSDCSFEITNSSDPCPPWESYLNYLERLANYARHLNFSYRSVPNKPNSEQNNARICTGRTFEVIELGRLLLQEYAPEIRRYYVRDEHFYEFNGYEDLMKLLDRVRSNPREAQECAELASKFHEERYSSESVVKHFATFI